METGFYMKEQSIQSKKTIKIMKKTSQKTSFGLIEVAFPFQILTLGMILSLMIFLIEQGLFRRKTCIM